MHQSWLSALVEALHGEEVGFHDVLERLNDGKMRVIARQIRLLNKCRTTVCLSAAVIEGA